MANGTEISFFLTQTALTLTLSQRERGRFFVFKDTLLERHYQSDLAWAKGHIDIANIK